MVCDQAFISTLLESLFFAGYFIGAALGGYLSDNYGRKLTFMSGLALSFGFGIGAAYSPNWWVFMILRICVGIFTNQAYSHRMCKRFGTENLDPSGKMSFLDG